MTEQTPTQQAPVSSPPKKSKRNLILAVVVLLVVVLAVGVYLGTSGIGSDNSAPTASPTPGGTSQPTSSGTSSNVAGASSLQYSVTGTDETGKSIGSYTFYAKNAGSDNMAIRIEYTDASNGDQMIYIVNGATKQAWVSSNGEWTDLSSTFSSQWGSWDSSYKGYVSSLAAWTGIGDYHYTAPDGSSITISNVQVNPNLSDTLFTHS